MANYWWLNAPADLLRSPSGRAEVPGGDSRSLMDSAKGPEGSLPPEMYHRDPDLVGAVSWWITATVAVAAGLVIVLALLGLGRLANR